MVKTEAATLLVDLDRFFPGRGLIRRRLGPLTDEEVVSRGLQT